MAEHEAYRSLTEQEKNVHLNFVQTFPGSWGRRGVLGSGESNFFDYRQDAYRGWDGLQRGAIYPSKDNTFGSNSLWPPNAADGPFEVDPAVSGIDVWRFFLASGVYPTYPSNLKIDRISRETYHHGWNTPLLSGIAASILAPDRLSFHDADLSNSSASLDSIIDQGLYDFDIFNPFIHHYGLTVADQGIPMPKWKDLNLPAGALHVFSDALFINYQAVYPKIPAYITYQDREKYNVSEEEFECIEAGGTWINGVCKTREEQECEDAGGVWDALNEECIMPEEPDPDDDE